MFAHFRSKYHFDNLISRLLQVHCLAKPEIFHIFDMDSNGAVDYYEFLAVLSSFREVIGQGDQANQEQISKYYFEMFDIDRNEEISRVEFLASIKQVHTKYLQKYHSLLSLFVSFVLFNSWILRLFSSLLHSS